MKTLILLLLTAFQLNAQSIATLSIEGEYGGFPTKRDTIKCIMLASNVNYNNPVYNPVKRSSLVISIDNVSAYEMPFCLYGYEVTETKRYDGSVTVSQWGGLNKQTFFVQYLDHNKVPINTNNIIVWLSKELKK